MLWRGLSGRVARACLHEHEYPQGQSRAKRQRSKEMGWDGNAIHDWHGLVESVTGTDTGTDR